MRLRHNGGAANCHSPAEFLLDAVTQLDLSTAHFHGRKKLPIRQHLIAFCGAGDPDITFHNIVIRCNIGVGERPIDIVAVTAGSFEINVAKAITLASPN